MRFKIQQLVIIAISFISTSALAFSKVDYRSQNDFERQAGLLLQSCDDLGCQNQNLSLVTFEYDEVQRHLFAPILLERAKSLARLWSDTVYAGDYLPAGAVKVYSIQEYRKNGVLILIRITYGQDAAQVLGSDCVFDEIAKGPRGEDCIWGSISESAVFSPNLKWSTVLDSDTAHFSN